MAMFDVRDGRLVCEIVAADFAAAFAVMSHVALIAEAAGHHPDMTISWNRLRIELWSHDVGAITDRDRDLAARLEGVLRA